MDKQEVIQTLYAVKDELMERHFEFKGHVSAPITAIDTAIEVLKAEPTDTDLISRRSALDSIVHDPDDTWDRIKALPSAEPKTGTWNNTFDGNEWYWYCSECKTQYYEDDLWMGGEAFPNYCPNCGADMRGKTHE